jgi:tryptophanase
VADTIIGLYEKQEDLRGLRIAYETRFLRHFTARFELV